MNSRGKRVERRKDERAALKAKQPTDQEKKEAQRKMKDALKNIKK